MLILILVVLLGNAKPTHVCHLGDALGTLICLKTFKTWSGKMNSVLFHAHKCCSKCVSMMTWLNGNIFRITGTIWGESTGWFPLQRSVTRSFDVFFDLRLNKWLSKQPRCRWFETSLCSLWRHCYDKGVHLAYSLQCRMRFVTMDLPLKAPVCDSPSCGVGKYCIVDILAHCIDVILIWCNSS